MKPLIVLLIGLCVTPMVVIAQPGSGAGGYGSVGPGGGGGPTNGQTAAQVSAAIVGGAIIQTNGTGTNTSLGTLTVLQGAVVDYYFASGNHLRTNNNPPFNWRFDSTNGTTTWGTNNVTKVTLDDLGNMTFPLANGGIIHAKQFQADQNIFAANAQFSVNALGRIIDTFMASESGKTNFITIDPSGTFITNDYATFVASLGGGGGTGTLLPPNALGVLTNNGSGNTNWSTSILGTWIGTGTLPATAADTSWPNKTNYYNVTNATAGNAVVVVGPDANNNFWLKGTNWPSGGGSQTPWAQAIDAAKFQLYGLNSVWITNGAPASGVLFNHPTVDGNGAASVTLTATTNNIGSLAGFSADFLYAQSAVYINNGTLHLNTNSADVITLNTNAATFTVPVNVNTSLGTSNYLGGYTVLASPPTLTTNSPPGTPGTVKTWFWWTNAAGVGYATPGYQ